MEGKLKNWNTDRGFGFIAPNEGGADVFVHIKALPRDGSRPMVGEVLLFDVDSDRDGRKRAVNVRRPGRKLAAARIPRAGTGRPTAWSKISTAFSAFLLFGIASYAYERYQAYSAQSDRADSPAALYEAVAPEPTATHSDFTCDGRTRCSQMRSCAEAKYFLDHCPGVQMDGNNDGEPCEQQWCQ